MIKGKMFYNYLFDIGVNQNDSFVKRKIVKFSNIIALLFLTISFLYAAFTNNREHVYINGLFTLVAIVLLFLNHQGWSLWCRFGLSMWPQFYLLVLLYSMAIVNPETSLGFSYIFIGLSIIPLYFFQNKQEQNLLFLILFFNLLVLIFHNVQVFAWSSESAGLQLFYNQQFIITIIPQVLLGIGIVVGFQSVKQFIINYEGQVNVLTSSLADSKRKIDKQQNEILSKTQELTVKQEKIDTQEYKLENANYELAQTKLALLRNIENLKDAKSRLIRQEAEAKSILETLSEHYLVAQYDLNGNLVSINKKVIELFGVVRDEQFQNIKPMINKARNKVSRKLNGQYFSYIWDKIAHGEAQTIELDIRIGNKTKCLATTFAPLFDEKKQPIKILAIGQDISDLIQKNDKVDKVNDELKEKIHEISQQNELLNFQQLEIFEKSQELIKQKKEIQLINESLELRVQERTSNLESKNRQLAEYAFINSHVLRAPVSTMLGLINLISYASLSKEDQKTYEHLKATGKVLDNVVHKINTAIDEGFHFNRQYLEPEREFHPMEKI